MVDPTNLKKEIYRTIAYIESEIYEDKPVDQKLKGKKKVKKSSVSEKMKQMKDIGTPTDNKKHELKNKYSFI